MLLNHSLIMMVAAIPHLLHYATRNLPIASIVAFAFDKTVCASGINTELVYAGVPDIEAIALVTGTYPSPP